ncbi:MAG: helix-turn-helix domain-containing protein [Bacteroidota bacterium]
MSNTELLTKKEAAKFLKVHVNTLTNWEKQNIISGKRLGRRVYYTPDELINSMG